MPHEPKTRIYTIQANLCDGETVERELRSESEERAISLMKLKFADATSFAVVSSRDLTTEDEIERQSYIVEKRIRDLDTLEQKHRQQKAQGLFSIAVGIVATLVFFIAGWIVWIAIVPLLYGVYLYSNGSWGIKRARRLRSWEMGDLHR